MGSENVSAGPYGVILGGANRAPNGPSNQIYPSNNANNQNLQDLINSLLDQFPHTVFTTLNFDLTNGFNGYLVPNSGTNIRFAYSPNPAALISVSLDQQTNGQIPLQPGNSIGGTTFDQFYLSAQPQSGVTATLVVWKDTPAARVLLR